LWTDGRTDGRTDGQTFFPSNIIRSTFRSRPNKKTKTIAVDLTVLNNVQSHWGAKEREWERENKLQQAQKYSKSISEMSQVLIIRYSYDTLCASGSRRFSFGLLSFCHDRRSASPSATNRQLTKSTTNNASTPLALRLTLMTMDGSFHFLDYSGRC